MTWKNFQKAIAPALLGVLAIIISWVSTGDFTKGEFLIALGGLVSSVGVYVVPNIATNPFLKSLVPAFLGLVTVAQRTIEAGAFDVVDARIAIGALLTSVVVWFIPNQAYAQPAVIAGTTSSSEVRLSGGSDCS